MHAIFSGVVWTPAADMARIHAVFFEFFEEIRRLESLLSRFVEDSDVARMRRMRKGESIPISPETYHCLEWAMIAQEATFGYFDVAYASSPHSGTAFSLQKGPFRITSCVENLHVDFGGIGKGFALDHASHLPVEYGVNSFLLMADSSTILVGGDPVTENAWDVTLQSSRGGCEWILPVRSGAVSCSGIGVRGEHLFNPHRSAYLSRMERSYVWAKNATLADAFSTALALMPEVVRDDFLSSAVARRYGVEMLSELAEHVPTERMQNDTTESEPPR